MRSLIAVAAGAIALLSACSESTPEKLSPIARSGAYDDLAGAPDLTPYAKSADLHAVASSGAYADLSGTPDIGIYATSAALAPLAFSGAYGDLAGAPDLSVYAVAETLAPVASSGSYADLAGAPDLSVYAYTESLSPVAFSAAYADLAGVPDLTVYAVSETLAPVASSGSYADLAGAPDLSIYARADGLAPVADSGHYDDLAGLPWVGDAMQISTSAGVSIGGGSREPLSVHVADYGSPTVDQTSPEDSSIYSLANSHWQSFTPGLTGVLVGVDVGRGGAGPGSGYTLNVYEGEGIGGTLVHTEAGFTIAGAGVTSLALVSPLRLEQGAQYTWELTHPTPFQLIGYNWGVYDGGRGGGNDLAGMDYTFATTMRPDLGTSNARLTVTNLGKVGVGTSTPTAALDVAGDLRVRASSSPASTDACQAGQISWDTGYVYVCVQTDTWMRAALSAY